MLTAFSSMSNNDTDIFYKQHPLNQINGLAVDANGYYYIGEAQSSSIQIYDNHGKFQYGFNFPTGGAGWFAFGIEKDKIHVVTARTDSHLIFEKGKLISSEEGIGDYRSQELQKKYHMSESNTFEGYNKVYNISLFNTISIKDKASGKVNEIHINTPIWPFNIMVFWIMGATGMGMIFLLHRKFFLSIINSFKK